MTPPPPKPTPPFDPPVITLISLIFFALTISVGCTSPDDGASLPATPTIQQTPWTTIVPISLQPPTAEHTIEATANDQTGVETPSETTTITPTITPVPATVIISYNGEIGWDKYVSKEDRFTIHYPKKDWTIYISKKLSTGEYSSMNVYRDTLKYMFKDFVYVVTPVGKQNYGGLAGFYKDLRLIIGIHGYDLSTQDSDLKYDGRIITIDNLLEQDLKDSLSYKMDLYDFKTDPVPYKINGNDATRFTYTVSKNGVGLNSEGYAIKNGNKYYLVAFYGGSIRKENYNPALVKKIMQSFETKTN